MDRYFKQCEETLVSSDLHLVGVVSMFIASKYEDVVPILMKTLIKQIGHNKFNQKQIELKEIEVLRIIGFKIGSPTIKEWVDRYIEDNKVLLPKSEDFKSLCFYISKLSLHYPSLFSHST